MRYADHLDAPIYRLYTERRHEQCQKRNRQNCLLAEHVLSDTFLIVRSTESEKISDFRAGHCEIALQSDSAKQNRTSSVTANLCYRVIVQICTAKLRRDTPDESYDWV